MYIYINLISGVYYNTSHYDDVYVHVYKYFLFIYIIINSYVEWMYDWLVALVVSDATRTPNIDL